VQQCLGTFTVWSYFGCHTCCGRSKSSSKDVGRPQRLETLCAAQGATAGNLGGGDGLQQEQLTALFRNAVAFYKFTRPHTMIGTFVSVVSISLLALQNQVIIQNEHNLDALLAFALPCACCCNC
jgi:hypothetical protein